MKVNFVGNKVIEWLTKLKDWMLIIASVDIDYDFIEYMVASAN